MLFARRLHLGVAALDDAARTSAQTRWTLLGQLHGAWPKLQRLLSEGLVCLRMQAGMSGEAEQLRPRVYALGERYVQEMTALLATLDEVALPDGAMLGRYLRGRCGRLSSAGGDPFEFIRVTAPIEDAFLELYRRVLAELAREVDAAERAHGIRPIRLFIAGVSAP